MLAPDRLETHNGPPMYVPCIKCQKPADLQETKPDRSRVFKCRNKQCKEVFNLPPAPPPPPPVWR
jgi:hypothetical protein